MIHITATEIITSTVLYFIVHTLLWLGKNAERFTLKLIKNEVNRVTHKHVKEKHPDPLLTCTDGKCGDLLAVTVTDATI